jgi:hypothetical protein
MNTNVLIGLVALIVVVGGGAWLLSSKGADAPEGATSDTQEVSEGSGSFGEMIARAGSWTCTVSTFVEAAPSEGTTYISNGMIRADFTSRPQALGGQEVSSHMIQADGYIYTWSDMAPSGMKMLIPKDQQAVAGGDAVGTVGADAQVEYSCLPWTLDSTKFVPPSTVSFMELGAGGMPQIPSSY